MATSRPCPTWDILVKATAVDCARYGAGMAAPAKPMSSETAPLSPGLTIVLRTT